MYLPGFGGCSSWLHLLVQHPKAIVAVGIMGAILGAVSSMGPGPLGGADGVLTKEEARLAAENPGLPAFAGSAQAAFVSIRDRRLTTPTIQRVLKSTESCAAIPVADVERDPALMDRVAYLYFLDLVHLYGIDAAVQKFTAVTLPK